MPSRRFHALSDPPHSVPSPAAPRATGPGSAGAIRPDRDGHRGRSTTSDRAAPSRPGQAVPKPVEGTSPYLPGLDGIRAIAVLAVIAYHLNFGWASGGLLGVQVFFVLSGLPDHRSARGRVPPAPGDQAGPVLAPAGPAAAARPLRRPVRDRRLGHPVRPHPAGRPPERPSLVDLLLQQLVVHLPPHLLLRPVRTAVPARAPVVAVHRGAVLPGVAAPGPGRVEMAPHPADAARAHPGRRRRLGTGDGTAVRGDAGGGPHPGLRRDRHPGVRAC